MVARVLFRLIFILLLILSSYNISIAEQWIKIPVVTTNIYYIYGADLKKTGIDISSIDPSTFKLFNQGKEAAINVTSHNGSFWESDYIEFYGTEIPLDSRLHEYSEENIYWLTFGGDKGKRMSLRDGSPGASPPSLLYYMEQLHLEQDNVIWQESPEEGERNYWFWGKMTSDYPTIIIPAYISHPYTANNKCTLKYMLYGRTDDPGISPDHHTKMYVNNHLIDDHEWDGITRLIRESQEFPCSYLLKGINNLKLESIDTGAEVNSFYLNWIDTNYPATFTSENNRLKFSVTASGRTDITISNFTIIDPIVIFDVADPQNVIKINNFQNKFDGNITFGDNFGNSSDVTKKYLIQIASVPDLTLAIDNPSDLRNPANKADYIIITPTEFYDSILALADYRSKQGYRVMVVKSEDVYDEFSFGIFDPQAIKEFLKYTYEKWQHPAPSFVLLVGDANLDYRDNWHTGEKNFIPTYMYHSSGIGYIPVDNWFVAFDDVIPQMAIGRLPVKNAQESIDIVNKIIRYETDPEAEWNKNLLFVSDDADSGETEFETLLETLSTTTYTPSFYNIKKVYLSEYNSVENARKDIASDIKDGSLITVYTGHGDVDQWAEEELLSSSVLSDSYLGNYNKPTFLVTLNCLNGFFAMPEEGTNADVPLAEALLKLKDNTGVVAAWSPTGWGYTAQHSKLAESLFNVIFNENEATIGTAITKVKKVAFEEKGVGKDMINMYTLFGDPATRLKKVSKDTTGKGGSKDSGGGGGGCFIATAAYGTTMHPHLKYLRAFRDNYLITNGPGREFVRLYYKYSPPAAEYIKDKPMLRMIVRISLLPLITLAWATTVVFTLNEVLVITIFAGIGFIFIKKYPHGY